MTALHEPPSRWAVFQPRNRTRWWACWAYADGRSYVLVTDDEADAHANLVRLRIEPEA